MKSHYLLCCCVALIGLLTVCSSSQSELTGERMNTAQIIKKLAKGEDVHLKGETLTDPLDFTRLPSQLANTAYHTCYVSGQLTFEDCIFEAPVTAYRNEKGQQYACHFMKGVSFMNCTFKDEFSFKGATVQGLANFSGSYFGAVARFEGAVFQSDANFGKIVTSKDVHFQQGRFHQSASFMNANLGGVTSFQGAQFDGNTQIGVVEFHGYADFSKAVFNEGCHADYGQYHDQAVFTNATFRGRAEFKGCTFDKACKYKGSTFYGVTRFNESTYQESLNLEGVRFVHGRPEARGVKLPQGVTPQLEGAQYNAFQTVELKNFIE